MAAESGDLSAGPCGEAGHLRDITAGEQAEQTLRRYAAELERSNRELQQFASVASHDLNEPLRKIQVFGDRLAATCGDALGEQGRDYLARMQSAAGRMRALIDGLLTYSRVTSRPHPFESTDLAEVVRDVVTDLEVRIDEWGARIDVGAMPTLDADAVQMRQLFQNLIVNALEFRRPDVTPTVVIRAEQADDRAPSPGAWEITVGDNGIGFAPADSECIFDVLTRLHGRGEYDGVGIGLAVCRRIAERHGGSIRAEGVLGAGATFTVILPASQPKVS